MTTHKVDYASCKPHQKRYCDTYGAYKRHVKNHTQITQLCMWKSEITFLLRPLSPSQDYINIKSTDKNSMLSSLGVKNAQHVIKSDPVFHTFVSVSGAPQIDDIMHQLPFKLRKSHEKQTYYKNTPTNHFRKSFLARIHNNCWDIFIPQNCNRYSVCRFRVHFYFQRVQSPQRASPF